MLKFLNLVSSWVWGVPLILLLVGTGVFYTILLKGLQFRVLKFSLYLGLIKRKEKRHTAKGDISHFQALMTALAATVGIGNIAGVATAISIGGPGALFWMWITGFFGMATKYAEAVLALKFRRQNKRGEMSGGPMYYISEGLKLKGLGLIFAIFTAVATFGIGNMVQSNSVAIGVKETFGIPVHISGALMAALTALVLLGGIKSIARTSSILVPFMILFYCIASITILGMNIQKLPDCFFQIFKGAFKSSAAVGGFLGSTLIQTIRIGVARGIFSNESGLGSSPIAAAAAKTRRPISQALVSMTQTFIDTIVVCTMTGLVIISSGVWDSGKTSSSLSIAAFNQSLPGNIGGLIVTVSLILFAYSTLLGWSYYGEKAMEFLFGERTIRLYRAIFCLLVVIGAVSSLESVWVFADISNGLMAFPNLVALMGLSPIVLKESRKYFRWL